MDNRRDQKTLGGKIFGAPCRA